MFLRLDHTLYLISAGLLIPVLAALTSLLIWSFLLVGGFAREVIARRAIDRELRPQIAAALNGEPPNHVVNALRERLAQIPRLGFVGRYVRICFLQEISQLPADKQIDDIEIEMASQLARLAAIGRLGPMLGLAGTLIPLGPALVELARGNVAALAAQLVVAFSATIVGLLIGMVAIACGQMRRTWYAKDLSDIGFLEELRVAANEVRVQP